MVEVVAAETLVTMDLATKEEGAVAVEDVLSCFIIPLSLERCKLMVGLEAQGVMPKAMLATQVLMAI
ncbi:unnamed protein product [marine sediment metagenome]|uniref:Uncharacterized protein n=1 Tax=marine sediment metagenome TaxID=412755 RepID=X1JQA9_9ZZZZ